MERLDQDLGPVDEEDFDFARMIDSAMKWSLRDSVVIREGEETEVELVFETPEAESALVTVEGRVRVGGQELESGMVSLFRTGSVAPYRFAPVRAGAFELTAEAPGVYRAQVQAGFLAGAVGRSTEVVVGKGPRQQLVLDLPGGRLAGRVIHAEDGRPAPNAVLDQSLAGDRGRSLERSELGEGTLLTDGEGRFQFEGLAAGSYEIFAKELFASAGAGMGRSGRLTGLTLADGESQSGLELRLEPGASLRVLVRDGAGAPRCNAVVTLLHAGGGPVDLFQRALTDSQGIATLTVPAGTYRASVDAPGAAPSVTEAIEVDSGATAELDVEVAAGCEVELRINGKLPDSAAAPAMAFSVWQPDGALLRAGRLRLPAALAQQGPIRLGSFAPGRYRVRLEGAGGTLELEETVPAQPRHTVAVDASALLR
jgi:hypothetical protein